MTHSRGLIATAGLFLIAAVAVFSAEDPKRPAEHDAGPGDAGLKVGQPAPAFTLKSMDGQSTFGLASHKGHQPVVLFFGSYT